MVFVADDLAEIGGGFRKIADHACFLADRVRADHADAVESGAVDRFEILAEQLVQAADHQHRHAVRRERTQQVGALEEVVDDLLLAGVLAAATQNHVHVLGPVAALVVGVYARLVAVQREPALDGEHVAGIAVDVHILRIQRHDVDDLAHIVSSSSFRCFALRLRGFVSRGAHLPTPASATSAILASAARVFSMAVYVQ